MLIWLMMKNKNLLTEKHLKSNSELNYMMNDKLIDQ